MELMGNGDHGERLGGIGLTKPGDGVAVVVDPDRLDGQVAWSLGKTCDVLRSRDGNIGLEMRYKRLEHEWKSSWSKS